MDLFEMLGIKVDVKAEEKTEPKKPAVRKEKKTAKETVKYTKGEINTGFCVWNYDFPDGISLDKLQEEFLTEYPGDFVLQEHGKQILLASSSQKEEDMSCVLSEDVRVVYGPYQLNLTEEKTVAEALAEFCEKFPEFDSCVAVFDKSRNMLYPRIVAKNEPAVQFPVRMGFGLDVLDMKDVPDGDYMSYMKKAYEKAYQVLLDNKTPFHYCRATLTWIPCFSKSSGMVKKKEVQTYPVPVSVRIPGRTLIFSKEQLGGKESVTDEDVRKALELEYFEYSRERTKLEWDKDHNLFIAILKTSSKGAGRVRKEPIGEYTLSEDNEVLAFRYTLPKIPEVFIRKLIEVGQDAYPNEVALQLFYDGEKYFLYTPEQENGSTYVTFVRNMNLEMQNILVADMHTHGRHPAFFSAVDDRDELGFRLYFVAGNLGSDSPMLRWRVGGNGHFLEVPMEEIIEMEE